MKEWNTSGRKIHIPDMEQIKKLRCKVCGKEFIPKSQDRYTARENESKGGIVAALSGESGPELYDCFDCPQCGCQMVVNRRLEGLKNEKKNKV